MADETKSRRGRAAVVDDVSDPVPVAAAPSTSTSARAEDLERENAALRARVEELEGSLAAIQRRWG